MRTLKLCALLVVLAAVVVPAEAVTIPPLPNGVTYLKSRNQDSGTTYVDLSLAPGQTVDLVPADFNGANPNRISFKAPGSLNGEDTWGIALTYHIEQGEITNPGDNGTIVGSAGSTILYDNSAGTQSTWLVAVFYGGVDTKVSLTGGTGAIIPTGTFYETITSTGVKFELYAVNKNQLGAGAHSDTLLPFNAADHTAPNTYVGWTDAIALAGGVMLLEGESDYFQSTVVVDDTSGKVVGSSLNASTAYFDIPENGAGLWNPIFGATDQLLTPDGIPTNLYFQWTLSNSTKGWTVKSDDIGGAVAVIPEPVTMLGLFLGIGGVGGYLRRRNRA